MFGKLITQHVLVRPADSSEIWRLLSEADVPAWVQSMVTDEIAENDREEGTVSQAGVSWDWCKRDPFLPRE
jgi:hypothetical protein